LVEYRKGYLFALLATVGFALNFIFSKYVLEELSPLIFCMVWFAGGGIYSLGYILLRRQGRLLHIDRSAMLPVLMVGVVGAVSVIGVFWAVKLLNVTVATLFSRMELVFTVIVGMVFLREKFNVREGIGLAMAVIGLVVMNWHSPSAVWSGFLLMAFACALSAVASAFSKHGIGNVHPEAFTFYRCLLIFVTVSIIAGIGGHLPELTSISGKSLAAVAAGTFCGPFVGMLLWFNALRFVDISKTSAVAQVMPLIVAVLDFFLFGSVPTAKEGIGGMLTTLGILMLMLSGAPSADIEMG
jgi:drug/metabolite transporter (DMT)-like permease